jgi:hypothetical protein
MVYDKIVAADAKPAVLHDRVREIGLISSTVEGIQPLNGQWTQEPNIEMQRKLQPLRGFQGGWSSRWPETIQIDIEEHRT